MVNPRETQFQKMVKDFPESPLGYFSLGKLYLELGRYRDAVGPLTEAVRLSPDFAAGLLALGSAYAGAEQPQAAKETLAKARDEALKQNHGTLASEAEERLSELEGG